MTTTETSLQSIDAGAVRLLPDVAFTGKAGSGKSTAASLLIEQLNYQLVSFANALREVAVSIWGGEALNDREKLQRLGVAVREIDEDAWVKLAARKIDKRPPLPLYQPITVDDLRFPNELKMLKDRGFVIVRVTAPRNTRVARLRENGKLQDESQLEHVSETALDRVKPDYVLENDERPEELAAVLSHLIYKEQQKRA
jgi:dephospho-CoA kinase